jgi:hypothetical protein
MGLANAPTLRTVPFTTMMRGRVERKGSYFIGAVACKVVGQDTTMEGSDQSIRLVFHNELDIATTLVGPN